MGCKICGKGSCASSFHSFEEQGRHEKYADMDVRELTSECVDKDNEIEDLKGKIKELNGKFVDLEQRIMSAMGEIHEYMA